MNNESFEGVAQAVAVYEQSGKLSVFAALDAFEIGQRIRQARINRGLKQKELIEDQFSKSYISSIEAGRLLPSPRAFEFFADRLGVSISYLQWGSETPPQDMTVEAGTAGRASLEPNRSPGLRKRLNWELLLTMAQLELERGQAEVARNQLLEQGAPSQEVSPSLAARYYAVLGDSYLQLSDQKAAQAEYLRAQEIAQAIPDRELVARLLNSIARCYHSQKRYSEAVTYHRQTLEAIRHSEINDPAFEADIYYNFANNLYLLNEQEQAIPLYREAVRLASQLNDRQRMAETFRSLSAAYHKLSNLALAKFYADRSLALYEELNNLRLATNIKSSFAKLLIERQEYNEAEECLKSALALAQELNDFNAAALAAANLSQVYANLKEAAREEEYGLLGVEYAQQSGSPIIIGQSLARVANMYAVRDNLEEADRHFAQAVQNLEPLDAHLILGGIYFEYGRTLMNLKRDREAAALFEKAYMLQSGYGPRRG